MFIFSFSVKFVPFFFFIVVILVIPLFLRFYYLKWILVFMDFRRHAKFGDNWADQQNRSGNGSVFRSLALLPSHLGSFESKCINCLWSILTTVWFCLVCCCIFICSLFTFVYSDYYYFFCCDLLILFHFFFRCYLHQFQYSEFHGLNWLI